MKTAIECTNGGYLIINYSAAEPYDIEFPLASGKTVYVTYEKELPEDAIKVPDVTWDNQKRWLVDNSQGCTLEGSPCSVAGWKNTYATLAPHFGGYWHTTWETVERVLSSDRNFTADDVEFASWAWLGYGDPVPDALQKYV